MCYTPVPGRLRQARPFRPGRHPAPSRKAVAHRAPDDDTCRQSPPVGREAGAPACPPPSRGAGSARARRGRAGWAPRCARAGASRRPAGAGRCLRVEAVDEAAVALGDALPGQVVQQSRVGHRLARQQAEAPEGGRATRGGSARDGRAGAWPPVARPGSTAGCRRRRAPRCGPGTRRRRPSRCAHPSSARPASSAPSPWRRPPRGDRPRSPRSHRPVRRPVAGAVTSLVEGEHVERAAQEGTTASNQWAWAEPRGGNRAPAGRARPIPGRQGQPVEVKARGRALSQAKWMGSAMRRIVPGTRAPDHSASAPGGQRVDAGRPGPVGGARGNTG